MSRNVNVKDDAVVLVLTPKQAINLYHFIKGAGKLSSAVENKIYQAAEAVIEKGKG